MTAEEISVVHPAVECKNASLGFANHVIIQNFNALISCGDFVGIFGPNGAGKTTFLRTILGLIPPVSGTVLLHGKAPERGHESIGYMPQLRQDLVTFPLTGRSYLGAALNGSNWGIPFLSKKQHLEIEEVIHLVGIENYVDRPFSQFSGGEKQRLALAQALLGNPKILLLDEPLSSLDPGQQEKIIHLIRVIQEQLRITILFTAHNINPLLGTMNRVIYLAYGKAAIGTVEEVVNSEILSWLYNMPVEVIQSGKSLLVIPKGGEINAHAESHRTNQ